MTDQSWNAVACGLIFKTHSLFYSGFCNTNNHFDAVFGNWSLWGAKQQINNLYVELFLCEMGKQWAFRLKLEYSLQRFNTLHIITTLKSPTQNTTGVKRGKAPNNITYDHTLVNITHVLPLISTHFLSPWEIKAQDLKVYMQLSWCTVCKYSGKVAQYSIHFCPVP